jgi:hypothetical protein
MSAAQVKSKCEKLWTGRPSSGAVCPPIVVAERDEMMHPQLAHVAERHRRGAFFNLYL